MTPKPRTLDDYMDGEYKDVNTGEMVNPDLPARTHMYIVRTISVAGKHINVISKTASAGV